ncbi:MAG: 3-dehydroquinate synthase [Ruminococcaceae bacterium]|nr:3-dehydroquinate synthase [Oscillospiraceae bacterium]
MKTLRMKLGERSYDITVGNGLLSHAGEYFNLKRKVFILTDEGVPKAYSEMLLSCCKEGKIYTVAQGEGSKSVATFEKVLSEMLEMGLSRKDALVSVGGGVVGDLGGFAAASYMRGIDFYQVPTTLLSQVDSSIGGKCAINLCSTKNVVGAFYQPKGVLIDTDTLKTLSPRLVSAGLAESIKMALTSDRELFCMLEREALGEDNIEEIIVRSLMIKKSVVEADEKENELRKILNFGHTLGHGIEAQGEKVGLYHGECVALGMLPMCSDSVRERLASILKKANLPTDGDYDLDLALDFVIHDKKCHGGMLDVITVSEVGSCDIEHMTVDDFRKTVKERIKRI